MLQKITTGLYPILPYIYISRSEMFISIIINLIVHILTHITDEMSWKIDKIQHMILKTEITDLMTA